MVRIGYIIGSTAEGSLNQKLARVLVDQAPEQAEMVHIPIRHLPLYHRDMGDGFPQAMADYKAQVAEVDGLLLVSPEHNQSFPAAVKNALDILTRPQGKNIIGGLPLGDRRGLTRTVRHDQRPVPAASVPPAAGREAHGLTGAGGPRRQRDLHRRRRR